MERPPPSGLPAMDNPGNPVGNPIHPASMHPMQPPMNQIQAPLNIPIPFQHPALPADMGQQQQQQQQGTQQQSQQHQQQQPLPPFTPSTSASAVPIVPSVPSVPPVPPVSPPVPNAIKKERDEEDFVPEEGDSDDEQEEEPEEEDEEEEESKFRLEGVAESLMQVMSSERLQLRLLQEWVIVSRQEFDFTFGAAGSEQPWEPYQVVSVMFHLVTGRYLVRVWHRTLWKGVAEEVSDLESVLWDAFHGTVPCLGVEERLLEETFDTRELPIGGDDGVAERDDSGKRKRKSGAKKASKRLVARECDMLVRREELSLEEQKAEVKTSTCFRCRSLLPEDVAEAEEKYRIALLNANVEVGIKESKHEVFGGEGGSAAPKRRKALDGQELKSNNQCKYCLEEFPSNQTRYVHERDVHLSGRFNCQICGRYCNHVPELLEHYRSGHPDAPEAELRCPICEKAEGWPDYIKHYKSCLEGKKSAVAKGEYKRKKKGKEEIKCHYCNKTFRKKCDLTNHYRSHNGEKLTCPECDFQSHSIHTIYTHRRSHARARGEEKTTHFCDLCGQNFTTRNYLQKHVRYAHEQISDDIKCEFCGEVFERQHTYNRHKNKEHSDDPRFACAECGARFGSESEVKKHSWSHSSQPRLFCDLCGKGLKTQKSMKAHMLAHRGEKPYKCDMCDYCCVSSSALSLHKRFKHRGGEPMAISKANGRA